ncbi:30S ribosomal protein S13 [PVC group bacterium (ex Bugula neritina AB1)]|nr:30S ribosomal protein S13 [PVC group bacterium (ex Bugula neritina AB1)]
MAKNFFQVCSGISNIGRNKINYICKVTGFIKTAPFKVASEDQVTFLCEALESSFKGDLEVGQSYYKKRTSKIIQIKSVKSLRIYRLIQGLPVRGQRTRTNARTCRNRRIKLCFNK